MGRCSAFSSVLLLAACLVPAAQAATTDEPFELYFRAAITIEPDGTLSQLDWADAVKIPAVLRERLNARVRDWTYEPGTADGAPARTESTLLLKLLAEPRDGGVVLHVENAQTGARMARWAPPKYPRDALYARGEAAMLATLVVDADGTRHVTVDGYEGGKRHRKAFVSAVEEMFALTPYQLERVDGHPVAAEFSVPVTFCMNDSTWCDDVQLPERTAASEDPPATPPGSPTPVGSVARLLTDVRGMGI